MYRNNFGSNDNPNTSESENHQFYQFHSPLYDYPPVDYETKCSNVAQKSDLSYYDKKQPFVSQEIKSQVNVVQKSKMKDQSLDKVKLTNVSKKQSTSQISTSDDKVDVASNKDKESYLGSYQQYAESFVESVRLLTDFEEQFADAPFQFLQPEEDDEPTEYSKIQSRFLQYNLKKNTGHSSDFFMSSDSDDGITVEIEQFQDYEKYLKISRGDTQDYSTSKRSNLLEATQTVVKQNTSLNKEVSHLDKSEDLSNQLNVLETTETVIEQNISLNKEEMHKSEEINTKVSDESEDEDAIVEISIESGFYLVQVRDVATQLPENGENLSKNSTTRVLEPSFSNIETQTCSTISKDETPIIFSSPNTSVVKVKNKRNNFSKKKSKQRR